jgi:hypothetical protein
MSLIPGVLANPAWNTSVGYPERLSHIDSIRAGSKGYMVVLTALDPKAQPRKIGHFNPDVFIPIGEVLTTPDGVCGVSACLPSTPFARLLTESASASKPASPW